MPDTVYQNYPPPSRPSYRPQQRGGTILPARDRWQQSDDVQQPPVATPAKAKAKEPLHLPQIGKDISEKKYDQVFPTDAGLNVKFNISETNPIIANPYSQTRLISVEVVGDVSDAFMSNLKLHALSVSPVLRMPKVVVYDLISANHQETYGKGKVKIRPFFTALIPHTCDQHIFVVAEGFKVSPTREIRVIAATKDVDYGDKIALYLNQRNVVHKPTPPGFSIYKAKEAKAKFDKTRLAHRIHNHSRDTLKAMVTAVLPRDAVADGTNVDPSRLKQAEDVVEQALSELKISEIVLSEIPAVLPMVGVGVAAAGGVIKLGMATLCAVRAYKLHRSSEERGKYPEFLYERRDSEVLFDRIMVHFKKKAMNEVIGAAKKFAEVAFRVGLPGSVAFVTTAKLTDQVYSRVLFRAREIYEVDLTNQMLRLAEQAVSSEGFYDVINTGHIALPAYAIGRYNTKDLSGARRTYIGQAENVAVLDQGVADLKGYARKIRDDSDYTVIGPN